MRLVPKFLRRKPKPMCLGITLINGHVCIADGVMNWNAQRNAIGKIETVNIEQIPTAKLRVAHVDMESIVAIEEMRP